MAAVPGSMLSLRGQLREGDRPPSSSVSHGAVQRNVSFIGLIRYMMFSGEALWVGHCVVCVVAHLCSENWELNQNRQACLWVADVLEEVPGANFYENLFPNVSISEQCLPGWVQDLLCLGRPLPDSIIVDNSPHSYVFQPDNALPIGTFIDDPNDRELLDILPVLMAVEKVSPDPSPSHACSSALHVKCMPCCSSWP